MKNRHKDPVTGTTWRRVDNVVQLYPTKELDLIQVRLDAGHYESRLMVRGGINDWLAWTPVTESAILQAGVQAHRALFKADRQAAKWCAGEWARIQGVSYNVLSNGTALVREGHTGLLFKENGRGQWRKLRPEDEHEVQAIWDRVTCPAPKRSSFATGTWVDREGLTWQQTGINEVTVDLPQGARVFSIDAQGDIVWRTKTGKARATSPEAWADRAEEAMENLYPHLFARKLCRGIRVYDEDEVDEARNEFLGRTLDVYCLRTDAVAVFDDALRYVRGGPGPLTNTAPPADAFDDGSGQLWVVTDDPQVVLGLPSDKWYACELRRSDLMFRLKDESGTWEPWTSSESGDWTAKIAAHFWPVARRVDPTSSLEAPQGQTTDAPPETWAHPETRHAWSRGPKKGEVACEAHLFRVNDKGQPEGRHKNAISWDLSAPHWKAWIVEVADKLWTNFETPADDEVKTKAVEPIEPEARTAASFLDAALGHMRDRATTYDRPAGERSMGNCVLAFNQLTGHTLTEEQGWLFMALLKITRTQQGAFRADNYEDLAAYAGLAGEAAARDR